MLSRAPAAAGDPSSGVLVLDRQRVELLLANEFKERSVCLSTIAYWRLLMGVWHRTHQQQVAAAAAHWDRGQPLHRVCICIIKDCSATTCCYMGLRHACSPCSQLLLLAWRTRVRGHMIHVSSPPKVPLIRSSTKSVNQHTFHTLMSSLLHSFCITLTSCHPGFTPSPMTSWCKCWTSCSHPSRPQLHSFLQTYSIASSSSNSRYSRRVQVTSWQEGCARACPKSGGTVKADGNRAPPWHNRPHQQHLAAAAAAAAALRCLQGL